MSGTCTSGIGVIPLVHSNGDLTLVYESFDNGDNMVSQTSHNGGVTFDPQVLRIEVRDANPRPPVRPTESTTNMTGRGLAWVSDVG